MVKSLGYLIIKVQKSTKVNVYFRGYDNALKKRIPATDKLTSIN